MNDLSNVAANAYMFRLRPKELRGGGGTYLGYSIPDGISSGVRIIKLSSDEILLDKNGVRAIVHANGKVNFNDGALRLTGVTTTLTHLIWRW